MTTEWEDIQRRIGNLPPLPPAEVNVGEDFLMQMVDAVAQQKKSHESDSLEQLDRHLEDCSDDDEEDTLEKLRRKRLAELKAKREKERFGDCREISKSEFVGEVSNSSKNYKVFVLIYTKEDHKGLLFQHLFAQVAEKFKAIKFLYMREDKVVVPMIIMYENGEPVYTYRPKAGSVREADELEWLMAQEGMLETDLEEDPRIHSGNGRVMINVVRNKQRPSNNSAA